MTTRIDNIIIGPGKVLVADPNTALPDESSVAYGGDWGTDWTEFGLLMTGSGVQMRHSVTMKEVMADGIIMGLKRVPTKREVGFAFSVLEYTPANLKRVFPDSTLTETAKVVTTQKAFTNLIIGAGQDNPPYAVGIEAFRMNADGPQPVRWRLYEASIEPDGETPFQQGSEAVLPVMCVALYNDDAMQVAELDYVTSDV